jgi:hypothetical protein
MNRWRDRSAEKGSILMITLIMLLVATMIGMMAITTSTTGISMMGNYKTASQTFYTTDSATKWALTNPSTFAMNLYAAPLSTQTFTDPGIPGWQTLGGFYANASGRARVTYLSTGAPPAGTSARYFQTNYFMIQTTGNGGANNAQDTHQIYFASTVAKDCGQSC